jgi:hypothetical protein
MTTKLEKKIAEQRKELYIINERCRTLSLQIKVIQDIDYYKSRLLLIAPNVAYKSILSCKDYSREIEAIFNRPFSECLQYYKDLLNTRNHLVHKFTSINWEDKKTKYYRRYTKKTLTELMNEY